MGKVFTVLPISGVPDPPAQPVTTPVSYSRSLRMAAARGGADTIVAYWGLLESAQKNEVTKVVSWVPFVGWGVPDEAQYMRIRLRLAVVDVRSGRWDMFMPDALDDRAYSAPINRVLSDQEQVEKLKNAAYAAAVEALVSRYAAQ